MNLLPFSRLFVSGLALMGLLWAQNPQIKKVLEKAGLKYSVDKDGDFKLVFGLENDRSQIVFITSETEQMADQTIVELWSPGFQAADNEGAAIWTALLADSQRRKVGAWQAVVSEGRIIAVYKAKIPLSSLTPDFLKAVCVGVASVADEVEQKVSQEDKF